MNERTDEEWIVELTSTDRARCDRAWLDLYAFLVGRVYYHLSGFRGVPQIAGDLQGRAEEIAQDSLIKILNALRKGRYNPALARFLTWATVVALNTARDAVRRHLVRHTPQHLEEEPTSGSEDSSRSQVRPILSLDDLSETLDVAVTPADPTQLDLRDFVHCVMTEELTDLQRTVCILYYYDGYRVREIADGLGKSEKAVENILLQVRLKFRRRASDEGFMLQR